MLQREKQMFHYYEISIKSWKFRENCGEIFEMLKIRENFPRKFSGKFSENFRKIGAFF